MESSNNSEIYDALVRIKNGEEISSNEIEGLDDLIYSFIYNPNAPGKSFIRLQFENEELYWKLFDELDDNDIWLANVVNNSYQSYEFYDAYNFIDDWKEGYLIRELSPENLSKISDILKLVGPKYHKLKNNEDFEKASKLLYTMFEDEIYDIILERVSEMNYCLSRTISKDIENETCDVFKYLGVIKKYCYYQYYTTVSILLQLYKLVNDTSLTIYELLSKLASKTIDIQGGWYDYMYDYGCNDFDYESFNMTANNVLDKIMDRITDDDEYIDNIKFAEEISNIIDNYDIDVWYKTPKDSKMEFKILDIDNEDQLIIVATKKNNTVDKRSYTPNDFNLLLYQPELF